MARYDDDAPESTGGDWHDGERWTLTGNEGEWSDEEQYAREALDCEAFPVPDDEPCDPPAYDDSEVPY
jgi:hypothetical protein